MKKYLEDLRQELVKRNLKNSEIDEIIADHAEMIEIAIGEGLSEEELRTKFGKPSQVAQELAEEEDLNPVEQENTDGYQLLKVFDVTSDSINVDVNLLSEDITYQIGSDSKIKVFYEGKGKVDKYEISFEKNDFKLHAPNRVGFSFSFNKSNDVSLLVELPREVVVEVLKQVTVSSDSIFSNLVAKQVVLNTTSGDIEIKAAKIGKFKLHTVSGDAHISNSKFEDVIVSLVSGDVQMENTIISGDLKANTVSGDLDFDEVSCVNLEVSAVSGDINGRNFYPQKIIFKSVSGDIEIKNKEKKYIEIVKKSTLSGEINIG